MDRASKREEFLIQIGGRIIDTDDPPHGISHAKVEIIELRRVSVADKDGFYSMSKLRRGAYTFRATADGFQPNERKLEVPEPRGDYYISLTSSNP